MKRLVSYIMRGLNYLMYLLSYHYRNLPDLYEALLSLKLSIANIKVWKPHDGFTFVKLKRVILVCPFLPKLHISHWLPVLSGSNPETDRVSTQGVPGSPTPKKKTTKRKDPPRPPPPPQKKKKKKWWKKGNQRKKEKKKIKKEGAIFANPPSEGAFLSRRYDLSRDMWFPTIWHFDKCRLRRACAASF